MPRGSRLLIARELVTAWKGLLQVDAGPGRARKEACFLFQKVAVSALTQGTENIEEHKSFPLATYWAKFAHEIRSTVVPYRSIVATI